MSPVSLVISLFLCGEGYGAPTTTKSPTPKGSLKPAVNLKPIVNTSPSPSTSPAIGTSTSPKTTSNASPGPKASASPSPIGSPGAIEDDADVVWDVKPGKAAFEEDPKLSKIVGVAFDKAELVVELKRATQDKLKTLEQVKADYKPSVLLKATFTKQQWSVLWSKKKVVSLDKNEDPKEFKFNFPLVPGKNFVEMKAVGPKGQIETGKYLIQYTGPIIERKTVAKFVGKRFTFSPSLGLTYMSFTETNHADMTLLFLTPKLTINWVFAPPRWDVSLNSFVNGVSLVTSSKITYPGSEVPSFRLLGVNGRVGYKIMPTGSRFTYTVSLGWYYLATLVGKAQLSRKAFGFSGVQGPQFYPIISFTINEKNVLSTYFKFSPIASGFSFMKLSNREIATGINWSHVISERKNTIGVGVDYSNDFISIPAEGGNIDESIQSFTASFSIGL